MPRLFCGSSFSSSSATRGILLASILVAWPATARADWFLTPFAGLKFAGNAQIFDLETGASNSKFTLGGIVGQIGDGVIGFEGEVGYTPRFFERSSGPQLVARSHVLTVMGNLVLTTPRDITGDSLRPFISGGAGWMKASIDDVAGILPIDGNLFAMNVGGGATGRVTTLTSARFELRYFRSVTDLGTEGAFPGTNLSFWRAAVGLTLRY